MRTLSPIPEVRSDRTYSTSDLTLTQAGPSCSYDFHENSEDHDPEEDSDEPLMGTEITKEAFEKAVEVLRRILGYEEPGLPPSQEVRTSKLSLHQKKPVPVPTMPVDFECTERFLNVSKAKKWSAFQAKQFKTFRLEDEVWQEICVSPSIPREAKDKLVAAGVMSKDKYKIELAAKMERSLVDTDRASRAGLKYASAMLLFAEVLNKSYQQVQREEISRKDTGAIITMLGPVARIIFDQFVKISVRSVKDRRGLLLDSLSWPSTSIKNSFADLPMLGSDLFGGKFVDNLQEEAKKKKALQEADFSLPKAFSSRQKFKTFGRPNRRTDSRQEFRPRQSQSQGYSRYRTQNQSFDHSQGSNRRYPPAARGRSRTDRGSSFSRRSYRGSSTRGRRSYYP